MKASSRPSQHYVYLLLELSSHFTMQKRYGESTVTDGFQVNEIGSGLLTATISGDGLLQLKQVSIGSVA